MGTRPGHVNPGNISRQLDFSCRPSLVGVLAILIFIFLLRPRKKIVLFPVTGPKNLGSIDR